MIESDTITINHVGEAYTISIEPDAWLRVKIYHESKCAVLQGVSSDGCVPLPPKMAICTYPALSNGSTLHIDVYDGDGEVPIEITQS